MKRIKHLLLVLFLLIYQLPYAQCAMCRAVLESEDGVSQAKGINNGITYLMVIPYILVAFIGFMVYRNRK